jgi:hypothetical protein
VIERVPDPLCVVCGHRKFQHRKGGCDGEDVWGNPCHCAGFKADHAPAKRGPKPGQGWDNTVSLRAIADELGLSLRSVQMAHSSALAKLRAMGVSVEGLGECLEYLETLKRMEEYRMAWIPCGSVECRPGWQLWRRDA